MSEAYLIAIGGRAPVDREANRALHQDLIDDLSREAAALGWPGARFHHYGRTQNYVSIEIVPGDGALSLDGLAAFREEQRRGREQEERQVA